MSKFIKLTVLFIFLAIIVPYRAYCQENKRIDVEMLGLDNIVPIKKIQENPKQDPESQLEVAQDPKSQLNLTQEDPKPQPEVKSESEQEKIESEKIEPQKIDIKPESKEGVEPLKEEPKQNIQVENGGIIDKIKSFVDKKTDKESKKIILKLNDNKEVGKETEEKNDALQNNSQQDDKGKLELEKKDRLDKLKEEYLIKISKDGKEIQSEEDIIIPRKKELNWGDSFYRTVDMAPPLISRSRSDDNSHIPIIPTFHEKIDSLFLTILSNDINAFNDFYSKIAIPDLRNQKGDTILTYALLLKRHPVASSILSKGADPDLPNALGHTPLDIAIENLDLKSVKILIDNHANINYIDKYSRTYLMLAARKGYLPIVQLLVESGADVNVSDTYGRTALNIAYRHKKEIVAKYLIKNGAKAWIEKPYQKGSQELIRELESRWKRPKFNSSNQ